MSHTSESLPRRSKSSFQQTESLAEENTELLNEKELSGKEPYAELRKNTVRSRGQIKTGESVFVENPEGKGLRLLFLGNSITLHGILPEIGWYHTHGMAASTPEKDYVHLVEKALLEKDPEAAFCICQGADWEREYKTTPPDFEKYASARDFRPDVIIMRIIENCPGDHFDAKVFTENLEAFLAYLNPTGKAKILLTTGFWPHPGNDAIRALAEARSWPLAELADLGENPAMKALGLFTHTGVANHPGDLGMEAIAARILEKLSCLI